MQTAVNYPLLARDQQDQTHYGFSFQGLNFYQHSFHIFAGLNAVDGRENVEQTFKALHNCGLNCARMGAFKPRTSPYNFQGLGEECLEYVFELAGKYGIKVIAMELTHERQLETVHNLLERQGNPTSIFVQIGTRNAQNFELLKAVGSQKQFPILYKRGYGITLEESLTACEYIAHHGNKQIIFCLRGMKSQFAAPHRNFVDFAHVPAIKRLTKMPVCIDPSHAVGNYATDIDGIPDIFHTTAQAIIAGTNMLLVDIHPKPHMALVDSKQAIGLDALNWYLEDIKISRSAYIKRLDLSLAF